MPFPRKQIIIELILINAMKKIMNITNIIFSKHILCLNLFCKPNQGTREIDSLLIPYFIKDFGENAGNLAEVLRQMRNKIGHGDFQLSETKRICSKLHEKF